MFDVAPTELMVVAIVALLVIGPKDLPKAMRFVGKWVGKARAMSRHFRSGLDTMMREAELEEMEKQWREHNAEIMRNYPNVAQTPPGLPAPGAEVHVPFAATPPVTDAVASPDLASAVAEPAPVTSPTSASTPVTSVQGGER